MKSVALCVLSLASVVPARADVICAGSDRWSIKTTAETSPTALATDSKIEVKAVQDILGLQRPHWQAPKKQYQTKQLPGEGDAVRVRGWLYKIGHDPKDSDYHLQLVTDLQNCVNKSVIVEVPDDRCVVAANLVPFERTARNELDVMLGHQPTLQGGEA